MRKAESCRLPSAGKRGGASSVCLEQVCPLLCAERRVSFVLLLLWSLHSCSDGENVRICSVSADKAATEASLTGLTVETTCPFPHMCHNSSNDDVEANILCSSPRTEEKMLYSPKQPPHGENKEVRAVEESEILIVKSPKKSREPSLLWALCLTFAPHFLVSCLYKLIQDILMFVGPEILR